MLETCERSTSEDKPILLDVDSKDLGIILLIIIGRIRGLGCGAVNFNHAQRLCSLMDSYKLNNHRLWFSRLCRMHAIKEPWEAIFFACNQTLFDKDLFMRAMGKGFKNKSFSAICRPDYYQKTLKTKTGGDCWTTLKADNIKPLLGLRLGLRGLLAYHSTFMVVWPLKDTEKICWYKWAVTFAQRMSAIEAEHKAVSNAPFWSAMMRMTDVLCRFQGDGHIEEIIRLVDHNLGPDNRKLRTCRNRRRQLFSRTFEWTEL